MAAFMLTACGAGEGKSAPENMKFDTTVSNTVFLVETQPIDSGYGYSISVDGKKFISQTIIPVIEGNHHFQTEEDALNTGKVVVKKMLSSRDLPSLTKEDLMMLGILSQDGSLIIKK